MLDVIKKLKFKAGGVILNAPPAIEKEFKKSEFKTAFDKKAKSTNTIIFVNNNKELLSHLKSDLSNIEPDSILWFAYPKGTSKIKTDINRDIIRVTAEEYGITTVAAISIDDTWSALRFRPIDNVGK